MVEPAPGLAPGERVEIRIEKAVYRGMGLARHHGQVIFVPRALPGERLVARVVRLERGYARAVAEERLAPAPGSRPSPCEAYPLCGGCTYQALGYPEQLAVKVEILREALSRAGVAWEAEVKATASPESGWRTRASFHVATVAGNVAVGLFEEGSRRVVDLGVGCPQVSPATNHLLAFARQTLAERPSLAGRVDHIHVAESPDGDERVMFLEGSLDAAGAATLASGLASPLLTGIGAAIGPRSAPRLTVLAGSPFVHADVLGVRLRSHARAFFQGNRFLTSALAGAVADLLPEGGHLFDLYGGGGLFGLTAGRRAETVTIVEGNELSAADAVENSRGLAGVRVVPGDVGEVLPRLPPRPHPHFVLDPPRAGLSKGVVAAVGAVEPAVVVYVSCDPATLARDLKALEAVGLRLDALQALDLFPDTFHVETVARLVRTAGP